MDDDLTPEQKFAVEDAETLVPRALLLGKPEDEIVADLIKLDYSPAAAHALVQRVATEMKHFRESHENRRRLIDQARWQFLVGLVLAVGGLVMMGLGFAVWMIGASGRIVLFAVPFGFFVWGLGLTSRGWMRWRMYRRWAHGMEQDKNGDQGPEKSAGP
ncbi:MAG: hypothetical protein HYX68_04775 [Planctomycetes bacterium]|nr:hypothetical protein [Planctomycetota bacterium]